MAGRERLSGRLAARVKLRENGRLMSEKLRAVPLEEHPRNHPSRALSSCWSVRTHDPYVPSPAKVDPGFVAPSEVETFRKSNRGVCLKVPKT